METNSLDAFAGKPNDTSEPLRNRLAKALITLPLLLTPLTAEAVVVAQYEEITLSCRSVKLCEPSGTCQEKTNFTAKLELPEVTYTSSHAPFSSGVSKWVRPVAVRFPEQAPKKQSGYRTLSGNDTSVEYIWRKASAAQKTNGWFGPRLPAKNDGSAEVSSSYRIAHTRTRPSDTPKLFATKTREIIIFDCRKVAN